LMTRISLFEILLIGGWFGRNAASNVSKGVNDLHDRMRTLVVYETKFGNTERIARLVAGELSEAGHEVSCLGQSASGEDDFIGVPLWVIGSPTHWGRAPFRFNTLLRNAAKDAGSDHDFVVFDTRYENMHSGAADRIHRDLARQGLRPLLPPQSFVVDGDGLRSGQEEKAAELGRLIASLL